MRDTTKLNKWASMRNVIAHHYCDQRNESRSSASDQLLLDYMCTISWVQGLILSVALIPFILLGTTDFVNHNNSLLLQFHTQKINRMSKVHKHNNKLQAGSSVLHMS